MSADAPFQTAGRTPKHSLSSLKPLAISNIFIHNKLFFIIIKLLYLIITYKTNYMTKVRSQLAISTPQASILSHHHTHWLVTGSVNQTYWSVKPQPVSHWVICFKYSGRGEQCRGETRVFVCWGPWWRTRPGKVPREGEGCEDHRRGVKSYWEINNWKSWWWGIGMCVKVMWSSFLAEGFDFLVHAVVWSVFWACSSDAFVYRELIHLIDHFLASIGALLIKW